MNIKYLKTSSLIMIILCQSIALAGLFGPSNMDECVLEGMKGVKSDAAAGAIYRACKSKFPPPKEIETQGGYPRIDLWDDYLYINRIGVVSQSASWKLAVTNKNSFPIAGVYIANTVNGTCPTQNVYKEIFYYDGYIDSNTTGYVSNIDSSLQGKFCIVGIKGQYQVDINKFWIDVGLQPKQEAKPKAKWSPWNN